MDPLTHTLAGAALADAGLSRLSRHARAALIVAANAPDVDALAYLAGTDAGFAFRRGWTHGALALLLWPPLLAGLFTAWGRRGAHRADAGAALRPWGLLAACAVGVVSHPLLDWLNTYGVRLLAPLSWRWFYGDAVFIVDPWLWLLLGGTVMLGRARSWPHGLAWSLLGLLASVPVLASGAVPARARLAWIAGLLLLLALRAARPRWPALALARTGLTLATMYVLALVATASLGRAWVHEELPRRGIANAREVMVGPTPADPFRWDVVVRTDAAYHHGTLWLPSGRLQLRRPSIARGDEPAAVAAARRAPCVAGTLAWMRFPFAEVEELPDGFRVHFIDARYGRERRRGFGTATVELDRSLAVRDGP